MLCEVWNIAGALYLYSDRVYFQIAYVKLQCAYGRYKKHINGMIKLAF